jgi:predicted enzyme related to lactoylglutathione lyase
MSTSTEGGTIRITGIDMSSYLVKDTDRAIAFYRDVLGLEPTTVYPNGGGAEYELGDGATFGLFNPGGMFPWQKGNGVMFAVDDFDGAVRAVKERGTPIHMQQEFPVCFMAMTEDSEGNQVILHKRKTS